MAFDANVARVLRDDEESSAAFAKRIRRQPGHEIETRAAVFDFQYCDRLFNFEGNGDRSGCMAHDVGDKLGENHPGGIFTCV